MRQKMISNRKLFLAKEGRTKVRNRLGCLPASRLGFEIRLSNDAPAGRSVGRSVYRQGSDICTTI